MPAQPAEDKKKFSEAFEEIVGTNWLPKLGVVILFIGLASWIASQWGNIPPLARIAMFYAVGITMLSAGIYFDRKPKDHYLVLGRSLIGVGWATVFLTTFALHHVAAVRLMDSLLLNLFLVLAVTAVMVWHTLRYESQLVTGVCFFLGFFTVAQSHTSVWSLLASVMLAAGLVVIALKHKWYELEIFGILASFLNHGYWLYPIIEGNRVTYGHNVRFDGYFASFAVLGFYWAVFRGSYIVRRVTSPAEETVSTVAGILNTVLLLSIAYYQAIGDRTQAFIALLTLGVAEIALALPPRIRVARPIAFRVLAVIGWCLIVAAVPIRFGGDSRAVLWLIASQVFFFSGLFAKERLFARFGVVTAILIGLYQIVTQGWPYLVDVFAGVRTTNPSAALVPGIAAVAFLFNAHVGRKLWPDTFDEETDQAFMHLLSYIAGAVLLYATYTAVPAVWASSVVAGLMLLLAFAGSKLGHNELLHTAHLFAAAAFSDVIVMNGQRNSWERIVTFLLVAAALYVASRVVRMAEERTEFDRLVGATYTWFGTALVALLVYFRLPDSRMAIVWAGMALLVAVEAKLFKLRHLWFQAHALAIAAVIRVLTHNLYADAIYRFGLSGRVVSVVVVGALLYATSRFVQIEEFTTRKASSAGALRISQTYTWIATFTLALLAFFETHDWRLGVIWAGFALALGATGKLLRRNELCWQASVLGLLAFGAALWVNMYDQHVWRGLTVRVISVSLIAAALYTLNRFAPREKLRPLLTWAASLLVSWLLWFEVIPINVSLAWAVFGVLLLELGLSPLSTDDQLKHLRYQAYVASIAAFARLFFVNFNAPRGTELLVSAAPLPLIFFYGYWRAMERRDLNIRGVSAATVIAYVASASVASILRFTLESDWVVFAWGAMFTMLMALATWSKQTIFRDQALFLSVAIAFRGSTHNVYQVHVGTSIGEPRNALMLTALVMAAALPFAFKLRDRAAAHGWRFLFFRPEQLAFFVPVALLLALFSRLFPGVLMTLSWGVLAVAVFGAALAIGERSFRLAGLSLLLICVAKIILFDVWNFNDTNARYMTLIAMGAMLLAVSFLYGRFREKVRELL